MLNVELITSTMKRLGLSPARLAKECEVSREAVSNWLSGESVPRPAKVATLAETLKLTVDQLFGVQSAPEPVIAYRMTRNRTITTAAREAGEEVARHLRELLPFTTSKTLFEPPHLREPVLDESLIRQAVDAVRASLALQPRDPVSKEQLFELFHDFGAFLVPVFWGGDKHGHENAMSVYLPDSKSSWVLFNLGCRLDDFKYWLAHEYGHCLTLHKLRDQVGEKFSERFAQLLVFPDAAAAEALVDVRQQGMAAVKQWARRYGVSVVTIVRGVDRFAAANRQPVTGLDTPEFYEEWKIDQQSEPTLAEVVFRTGTPSPEQYVSSCESVFRTPVFTALARWQEANGGRSAAFIAAALNVGLGDANELSHVLWGRQD